MGAHTRIACDSCGKEADRPVLRATPRGEPSGWWQIRCGALERIGCSRPCAKAQVVNLVEDLPGHTSGIMFTVTRF